jgi:hypothetical protein
VRRLYEAEFFEIGHDVANRGGTEIETRLARQRTGTDGLPVANVAVDENAQQSLRALV